MKTFLIVGLGNPGPKYETTRHNAGFLVLDQIAKKERIEWQGDTAKIKGDMARGTLFGESCILLKPMTFMNRSGQSVAPMMRFFKIPPQDLVVIYDDIDVPKGKVKARIGGSDGGHNGIKSIIADFGSAEFHRIKIGVGKPGDGLPPEAPERQIDVVDWVLGQLSDEELLSYQSRVVDEVLVRLKGILRG